MKVPAGIWKKINFNKDLIGVDYFGIGKNKIIYNISRVEKQYPYKWIAVNPGNKSDSFFGKTLSEIKIKLDTKGV
jgi:hypothetical protein